MLELLLRIDKTLDAHQDKALLLEADELFNIVFKITYYDDPDTSVCNAPLSDLTTDLTFQSHSTLLAALEDHAMEKAKINCVVNNILLHHLQQVGGGSRDHKMRLLISLAEFIHSAIKMISTRRLARILYYMALLYSKIEVLQQAPFLMGSIFTLGGLLKIEVRNYLQTKRKYEPDFRVVSPLVEESNASESTMQRYKRDLTNADVEFFEAKHGFLSVVTFFVNTLTAGKRDSITAQDASYYLDFSGFEYGEIFDEEKRSRPDLVGRLESAHYILCFLFDLLQFCF